MSDDKKMTAAEAWAEVDRLEAIATAEDARNMPGVSGYNGRRAAWDAVDAQGDIAAAIGPRPEVPS